MYNCYSAKGFNEETKDSLNKNEVLIAKKLQEIEDLKYEIDLIKSNSVERIKSIYDPFASVDLHKIWIDFDQDKKKFSKENKESKDTLKFIEDTWFFGKDHQYKLTDIRAYGYDDIGYEFLYKIHNIEFYIFIPVLRSANVENYNRDMFYQVVEKTGDSSWTVVFKTRFIQELKKGIEDFIISKLNATTTIDSNCYNCKYNTLDGEDRTFERCSKCENHKLFSPKE